MSVRGFERDQDENGDEASQQGASVAAGCVVALVALRENLKDQGLKWEQETQRLKSPNGEFDTVEREEAIDIFVQTRFDNVEELKAKIERLEKAAAQASSTHQRELHRKERSEFGLAKFFMGQSGQVRDATAWILFVQGAWSVDGVPLPSRPQREVISNIIRLYERVLAKMWDDHTVDLVRELVLQLESAQTALINVLLELMDKSLVNLRLGCVGQQPGKTDGAHHAAFDLWEGARLMRRSGWQAPLVLLFGRDYDAEPRALIRPGHRSSSPSGIGPRILALDLAANTIRVIHKAHGIWGFMLRYRLRGLEDTEDIYVPSDSNADLD
ncbi:hypothetical protein DL768_000384 [Monosporascus sp. mg162]|nr:hypothetical protein DL768_000384 [Monosporascus sp. mg162]